MPVLKKQKTKSVDHLPPIVNINSTLNDKCLINIFEYLPLEDKLKIESVCKKWKNLGKLSWSKVTSFEMNFELKINHNFYLNVIKRAGIYINNLILLNMNRNTSDDMISLISQEILNKCQNIISLKLENHFENSLIYLLNHKKKFLKLLFKKNKKISKISLLHSDFNADLLLHVNADQITEFEISRCFLQSRNSLYIFLTKLKNLEAININNCYDSNEMITALNRSKNDIIREFSISGFLCNNKLTIEFPIFLAKQKKLSKLSFENCELDLNFINTIKFFLQSHITQESSKLKKIYDELTYCFSGFKYLTVLECKFKILTDEIVKNLTKCVSLKKIKFNANKYSLTEVGENSFSGFYKLESFAFDVNVNINRILQAITRNNKNFKELNIAYCKITDTGLESIYLHKNLIYLSLSIGYVKLQNLVNLIIKLLNLKEIHFPFGSYKLRNYSFFKTVNHVKLNRGDKDILYFYMSKYSEFKYTNYINKNFSLVCICNTL